MKKVLFLFFGLSLLTLIVNAQRQSPLSNTGGSSVSATNTPSLNGNNTYTAANSYPATPGIYVGSAEIFYDNTYGLRLYTPVNKIDCYNGSLNSLSGIYFGSGNIAVSATTTNMTVTGVVKSYGYVQTVTIQNANYSVTYGDSVLFINANSVTNTLPTAVGIVGKDYYIKYIHSGGIGYVATTASQTIDGAASPYALSSLNQFIHVVSDGSNWQIIGK